MPLALAASIFCGIIFVNAFRNCAKRHAADGREFVANNVQGYDMIHGLNDIGVRLLNSGERLHG